MELDPVKIVKCRICGVELKVNANYPINEVTCRQCYVTGTPPVSDKNVWRGIRRCRVAKNPPYPLQIGTTVKNCWIQCLACFNYRARGVARVSISRDLSANLNLRLYIDQPLIRTTDNHWYDWSLMGWCASCLIGCSDPLLCWDQLVSFDSWAIDLSW